jgi:hypothetical protein
MSFEHLCLAVAAIVLLGGAAAWRSTAKSGNLTVRILISVLRMLALACLGLIAFNPGQWQEYREDRKSEWAILVDRSSSMSTADVNGKSRWTEADRLAQRAQSLARAGEMPKIHTFATQLEAAAPNTDSLAALKSNGEGTDIIGAGMALLNEFRSTGTKLSGVILLSDGRQVSQATQEKLGILARSQESPVFPLVIGGEVPARDLILTAGRKQYVTFTGQKLRLTAFVSNQQLGRISPTIQLLDATRSRISEQKLDFTGDGKLPVQFEVAPTNQGYHEYTFKAPAWEGETALNNNEASVGVTVLSDKMRVLIVEGVPFWDTKFVTQLFRKQSNIEVTSIYRLSSDRFFKVETDASKVSDSEHAIFPDDAAAMSGYDIIMFGKGAEYFLTPERVKLLKDFIVQQGGCVIFSRGKPYGGTFPELEPIEPVVWGDALDAKLRFRPTQDGELAGLFGELLPGRSDPAWNQLPQLQYASHFSQMKAFTRVMAEGVPDSVGDQKPSSFPVLISRRYGKGIVVVVNAEGLWQWHFFPSVTAASEMYQEFWTQLLAWSATYSEFLPGQKFSLRLSDASVWPDVPVRATISRRNAGETKGTPALRVIKGTTIIQEIPTVAGLGKQEERWDAVFSLKEPGTYRIELTGIEGMTPGENCATLSIKAPPSEQDNLSADPAFLKKLADDSGGRMIAEQDLEQVVKELQPVTKTVDMSKAVWTPAWDRWWILVILLSFLGLEWILRRRSGLM